MMIITNNKSNYDHLLNLITKPWSIDRSDIYNNVDTMKALAHQGQFLGQ